MSDDVMPAPNIEVVALSPMEMAASQEALQDWCRSKIAEVGGEVADARERVRVTAGSALETDAFTRQVAKGEKSLTFYRKLLSALQAGYLIVPNLPIDVFAIRTTRVNPSEHPARWRGQVKDQAAMMLPEGKGRYVSPKASIGHQEIQVFDPQKKEMVSQDEYFAESFQEMGFPAVLAKPRVLEATKHALALKLFDEIGLVGQPAPKKDPIIAGRIYRRMGRDYQQHFVTFFVAWWLNTRAL